MNLKESSDNLNEGIITRDDKRQKNIKNGSNNYDVVVHLSLNRWR